MSLRKFNNWFLFFTDIHETYNPKTVVLKSFFNTNVSDTHMNNSFNNWTKFFSGRFQVLDNRFRRFVYYNKMPIRVSKTFFSNKGGNKLFSVSSHDIGHKFFNKFSRDHSYITIKQKRYVPKKFRYTVLPNNFISGLGLYQGTMELKDQKLLQGQLRSYNSSITSPLYKRLLRTRRMLVLPAHVNLAVITNSFDVIHS
jgi:hypothetical protein